MKGSPTNEELERIRSTAEFIEKANRGQNSEDEDLEERVEDLKYQLLELLEKFGGAMAKELLKARGVSNAKGNP